MVNVKANVGDTITVNYGEWGIASGKMTATKVNVGDKIVATRDLYYTVTKGTVMVVTKDMNGGDVFARIHESDDNYSWFMPAGSYEPYGETPTLWRDMTDAEKGALLLAKHDGKGIEIWQGSEWKGMMTGSFGNVCAYRINPTPVTRTVDLMADFKVIGTITLIDGIPDPTSICMASV